MAFWKAAESGLGLAGGGRLLLCSDMATSATLERRPQTPRWFLWALLISLTLHVGLYFWSQGYRLSFGPPGVDPIDPPRFRLERATIDPARLEPEAPAPSGPNPQRQNTPASLAPGEIEAFAGPLSAPRIPLPTLEGEPMPLSAGPAPTAVDALNALPLQPDGKTPSLSQALVDEATTAALLDSKRVLSASGLAGGPDAAPGGQSVPGAEDIAALIDLRPPGAVERPGFQPILIRLSNELLFAFDSSQIQPGAEATLQRLAAALQGAVKKSITVEGHTDSIGGEAYNQRLSEQRAGAVAEWLIARGIPRDSIRSVGYGRSRPIVPTTGNAEEEKLNRRVEIRIEAER
jgi:outer membrane protein OmpA-like peptidoglycan-associated protein